MSDSMVNDGWRLKKRLKSTVRSIHCATIKEISRHAKVCLIHSELNENVFRHGTNNPLTKSSPDDIAHNLIKPSTSVKASTIKIFVTGITKVGRQRKKSLLVIKVLCKCDNIPHTGENNINKKMLSNSNLHIITTSITALVNNVCQKQPPELFCKKRCS